MKIIVLIETCWLRTLRVLMKDAALLEIPWPQTLHRFILSLPLRISLSQEISWRLSSGYGSFHILRSDGVNVDLIQLSSTAWHGLQLIKHLPHWLHGSFLADQLHIRARVAIHQLKRDKNMREKKKASGHSKSEYLKCGTRPLKLVA